MGISRIVNPFYEAIYPFTRNLDKVSPGQLVWSPVGNVPEVPKILEAERADPKNHLQIKFKIRDLNPTSDFRAKERLPIAALPLGPTEEYLVMKSKERLCVVLARANTAITDSVVLASIKGKRHLQSDDMILLPLYGIQGEGHLGGISQVMLDRIRTLQYKQYTYFPKFISPSTGTGESDVYEGVGRFDRIFSACKHHQWIRPIDVRLKPEAFGLLLSSLKDYLNLGEDEEYRLLRDLLSEKLKSSE